MSDPMLTAIANERRMLRARLAALDEMERRLKANPRPNGGPRVRAPYGGLREAIVVQLKKAAKPATSIELKRRLRSAGYRHHINGQYFTKILRQLSETDEVRKHANGGYSTYEWRG